MHISDVPWQAESVARCAECGLGDVVSDSVFNRIADAAAALCESPIGLMSRSGGTLSIIGQHGLAASGIPGAVPLVLTLCEPFCALLSEGTAVEVEDVRLDPRFADNALVSGVPHISHYFGVPLVNADGATLGALCVFDVRPRRISEAQKNALARLALLAAGLLESSKRAAASDTWQLLRTLVDQDDDEVLVVRADSLRVELANAAGLQLACAENNDEPASLPLPLQDAAAWADFAAVEAALKPLREGLVQQLEFPASLINRTPVGRRIQLQARRYRLQDDTYLLLHLLDCDEPESIEADSAAALLWRQALECTGAGVIEWNLAASVGKATPAWLALMGLPEERADAPIHIEEWLKQIHLDDQEHPVAALLAPSSRGLPGHEITYRVQNGATGYRWLRESSRALRLDALGKPLRAIAVVTDVTAQIEREEATLDYNRTLADLVEQREQDARRARQRLAHAEAALDATFDAVDLGLAWLNARGEFVRVNAAFGQTIGVAPAVGASVYQGLADRQALLIAVCEAIVQRVAQRVEVTIADPFSRVETAADCDPSAPAARRVSVGVTPVITDSELAGVLLCAGPVVSEAASPVDLQRALQQQRWLQNQAKRSADDLEFLTGAVSHELRAPLSYLTLLLRQLAQRQTASEAEQARLLGIASDGAARMEAMAIGLVEYARAHSEDAEHIALEPAAVFRNAWTELERRGKTSPRVRLVLPRLPRCMGSEDGLQRVATELLANALKFSAGASSPTIEIGSFDDPSRPAHRIYFVRDNGVGFPPDRADRLFRPLTRVHRASEFPGSGLGLATAHRAVERMGGTMWAESGSTAGATFYFMLPAVEAGGGGFDPAD